jgi:hypothetical protein
VQGQAHPSLMGTVPAPRMDEGDVVQELGVHASVEVWTKALNTHLHLACFVAQIRFAAQLRALVLFHGHSFPPK